MNNLPPFCLLLGIMATDMPLFIDRDSPKSLIARFSWFQKCNICITCKKCGEMRSQLRFNAVPRGIYHQREIVTPDGSLHLLGTSWLSAALILSHVAQHLPGSNSMCVAVGDDLTDFQGYRIRHLQFRRHQSSERSKLPFGRPDVMYIIQCL